MSSTVVLLEKEGFMEGHLLMSDKERRRKTVFDGVKAGRLTIREAAEVLGLSYRQARRSYKRFSKEGDAGLVHRSRGRCSNRRLPLGLRRRVVARYRQRYEGFGPTLAAEKLAEDGLEVDHETLRRWLLDEGLWRKRRKRAKHRERRERKHHFGELVQMDGSFHKWFGPDRGMGCLMNLVDDAQGTTLSLLSEQETTAAAMRILWQWIERYGVPKALYTDKKTVYVTDREPTLEEQLADETPQTAFGKACAKLGIEIITAHSPQAKGRVERNHAVYQDRFVKELGLRRITTLKSANALLAHGFIDGLNSKFAHPPASEVDYHQPLAKGIDLADVFCFEERRVVQNDWCVRHQNRHYQILESNRLLPKPKDKVLVRTRLDGSVHLLHRGRPLKYRALSKTELRKRVKSKTSTPRPLTPRNAPASQNSSKTPWRQGVTVMFADSDKKKKS